MCVPAIWWERKQLPFDFYVYFEGSPPAEEPLGIMPREGAPPILYVPMFPGKYFFFLMKRERSEEIKRVLLMERGGVPVLMHSPEVWEYA
jgi:hypothetical protein